MPLMIQSIDKVAVPEWLNEYTPSGIAVLDEFINGNGIIPSQVISLSASRGSGKTTLMLQYLDGIVKTNPYKKVLYVSREEPSYQIKKTATRIGASGFDLIGDEQECTLDDVVTIMKGYNIVVLDSFSCMASDEKASIKMLKDAAKETQCSIVCILHQTKAGDSAGSSQINHLVDTVIDIERADAETFGDDITRILKMDKNRFGSCGQVILKLQRAGWDFENPVEAKSINEENKTENARNSAQAKKPQELKDILAIANKMGRFAFSDVSHLIPADDSAAIGRFERHIKELEKYGKLLKIGRGNQASWEIIK